MSGIHSDITSAFGNTPLVTLNHVSEGLPGTVIAKLEYFNPGSSVKDRIGIAIIDAAEASGELKPGGTIVEGTSGNTGIALALVGAARGYKVILTMPSSMSTLSPSAQSWRIRSAVSAWSRLAGTIRSMSRASCVDVVMMKPPFEVKWW